MPNQKEIKTRIKSVKNTGKITKAMELISTVKMKKAQDGVLGLRPFALATLEVLSQISHEKDVFLKYSEAPASTRELIIMVASQKWLCGGYNVNVYKKATEYIRDDNNDGLPYTREYDYIAVGKRARDFILRTGQSLVADFSDELKDPLTPAESRRIVRFILNEWMSGKYEKISIVYNHYISAINQLPVVKTLFPLKSEDIHAFLEKVTGNSVPETPSQEFTIEPSPEMILDYTLPMILDALLHETLLEAKASEHAARMVAMKNAKDSANKKAAGLTLVYNKTRQSAITKEVSEIVSGVESMKDA